MDVQDPLSEARRRTRRRAGACSRRGRSTRRRARRSAVQHSCFVRGARSRGAMRKSHRREPELAGTSEARGHPRRSTRTSAISAGKRAARAMASASATKLLPRPESRIATERTPLGRLRSLTLAVRSGAEVVDHATVARDHSPDRPAPAALPRRAAARSRPARPGATTATMPIPMLKTRNISSSSTSPFSCSTRNGRRNLPAAEADLRREPLGQDARHVVGQAAAGDVRQGVQARVREERRERLAGRTDAARAASRRPDASPRLPESGP